MQERTSMRCGRRSKARVGQEWRLILGARMATKRGDDRFSDGGDTGVITESKTERKTKRPPLYKVMLHNDDYTTREFVVDVLVQVFHHAQQTASQIMRAV